MILALAFVASFLLSLGLTLLVKRLALKFKIVDSPSETRKIHTQAIPLLGGLAVFLAFFIVLFIFNIRFGFYVLGSQVTQSYCEWRYGYAIAPKREQFLRNIIQSTSHQ